MDHFIALPYGAQGEGFKVNDLVNHIKKSHGDYIIQGQVNCVLANHPKPNSLDVWMRKHHTSKKNTKQATNEIVQELLSSGEFEQGKFACPDSGRLCKGLRLRSSR
jgi:hypothetical protein